MGDVAARNTHYMVFPHTRSGVTRASWTMQLFKDGVLTQDIPIDIKEESNFVYVASFDNDGSDYTSWTLVLNDPAVTDRYYVETWEVRKKTVETTVKQLRSRQDSEGGFFKSSYDREA